MLRIQVTRLMNEESNSCEFIKCQPETIQNISAANCMGHISYRLQSISAKDNINHKQHIAINCMSQEQY